MNKEQLSQMLEESRPQEVFPLFLGLCDKNEWLQNQNSGMDLMIPEDAQPLQICTKDILEELKQNSQVLLGKVYFDGEYDELQTFLKSKMEFFGFVQTDHFRYFCKINLELDLSYQERLKDLQKSFLFSNKKWRMPFCPHLNRFFNVYLTETDIPFYEEFLNYSVSFGPYEQYLKWNLLPVWNVSEALLPTDIRPYFSEEEQSFCHLINLKRVPEGNEILFAWDNPCQKIIYTTDRIVLHTDFKQEHLWKVLFLEKENHSDFCSFSGNNLQAQVTDPKGPSLGSIRKLLYSFLSEEEFTLRELSFSKEQQEIELFLDYSTSFPFLTEKAIYIMEMIRGQYPEFPIHEKHLNITIPKKD